MIDPHYLKQKYKDISDNVLEALRLDAYIAGDSATCIEIQQEKNRRAEEGETK